MRKCKLGDLFEIKQGYAFKSEKYQSAGKYVLCTLGNISADNNFKYDLSKANYYPDDFSHTFILEEGDLIIPLTEQAVGLFGNTAFVPSTNGFQFVLNQRVGKVIPKKAVADKYYLHYLLSTELVRNQIEATATGTSQRNTSPEKIYDATVWVPDIEQQRKIGKTLFDLERKVNINKLINDNLQQQLKLLYDYWFTQFDFPDESGKPYRSSGGQMIWDDRLKRDIPVGWEVKPLSQIMKKNVSSFDYSTKQPAIDLSVMPSDTIALSEINTSDNFTTNLFKMKKGDILFGSIRPYLHKAGFAPCDGVVAGTVHSYRAIDERDSNFALLTIACDTFFDYAVNVSSGTKMPVVSSDSILAYNVPYNSDVVKRFGTISIVETIANIIQENQQLITLRDWLLPMLMNGQATISD